MDGNLCVMGRSKVVSFKEAINGCTLGTTGEFCHSARYLHLVSEVKKGEDREIMLQCFTYVVYAVCAEHVFSFQGSRCPNQTDPICLIIHKTLVFVKG